MCVCVCVCVCVCARARAARVSFLFSVDQFAFIDGSARRRLFFGGSAAPTRAASPRGEGGADCVSSINKGAARLLHAFSIIFFGRRYSLIFFFFFFFFYREIVREIAKTLFHF